MIFQQHCSSLGIQLLRDDIRFIKSQLLGIPKQMHRQVLQQYADTWLRAMGSCGIVYRKQNIGRKVANVELREHLNGKD